MEIKKSAFTAIDYSISDQNNKLIISAKTKTPLFNKIMVTGFLLWFVVYSFFQTTANPNLPWWLFPFVLCLGGIGLVIGLLIAREANKKIGTRQIIVNKTDKTIEAPLDDFKASFDEIKDISLTERQGFMKTTSLLKFHLNNGEKTLLFPFSSYSHAQEVLKLLKEKLK